MSARPISANWADVGVEFVMPGVERQVIHGVNQTMVRYVYAPGSIFPIHAHQEEQCTIVISGRIEFNIDGTFVTLAPGGVVVIPSGVPHGARVIGAETVESFNALSPRRAENPLGSHKPGDE